MRNEFRTVREAHNAMCLDIGFDPFLHPHRRRVTRRELADLGYVVSAKNMCEHRQGDGSATAADLEQFSPGDKCPECGCKLGSDGYWYIDAEQAPVGGQEGNMEYRVSDGEMSYRIEADSAREAVEALFDGYDWSEATMETLSGPEAVWTVHLNGEVVLSGRLAEFFREEYDPQHKEIECPVCRRCTVPGCSMPCTCA